MSTMTWNYSNTFNFTLYYPANDRLSSYWNKVLMSYLVLLMLICVLTILGNTLVLVVTWRDRSLHEPNKYFIVCLAIADLLVGMFSAPVVFYQRFIQLTEGHFPVIPGLCHFHVWMDVFATVASIYTLTFISFDRYTKISKPFYYRSRMTTSISVKVIFIIFLISTVYAIFSIFPDKVCVFTKTYFTFLVVTSFVLPIIIMVIMYSLIFRVTHKRQKMLRNGELGQTFNDQNVRTTFLKDLKIIRMFVIVVGMFIICWGPFFICWTLRIYKPEMIFRMNRKKLFAMELTALLLPPMNSLCNPIIYACLDQKYKEAFKRLLQKLMRRLISGSRERPTAMELRSLNQPTT